jgi:hypothetical protein
MQSNIRRRELRGGQRDADEAAREQRVHLAGVGLPQAHRAPGREARGQRGCAGVVGVEQRRGLLGWERLDPERAGERDQDPVEPVPVQLVEAQVRVGVAVGEHAVGLAGEAQRPAASAACHRGRLVAAGERRDEWLAEQVLVDVDAVHVCILLNPDRIYKEYASHPCSATVPPTPLPRYTP